MPTPGLVSLNPNQPGGWHNVPQNFHLSLILLAIVHPDGNQTTLSRALLDADFGPVGCGSVRFARISVKKARSG